MSKRLAGSKRTRDALNFLIDGRLAVDDAKSELVRLATRLIIEEDLEPEVRNALDRDCYEHGSRGDGGRGGYHDGARWRHLKTAREGRSDYVIPTVIITDRVGPTPSCRWT